MLQVIKKDNNVEAFNSQKIVDAIRKAAFRCDREITVPMMERIAQEVRERLGTRKDVTVAELHELVIAALAFFQYKEVAEAYAEYRYYKTTYAKTFEQLRQDADDVLRLGDRENANYDSSLVSTKGSLIKGYLTKSLYKQFYLSKREKELIERGDIYIHDLRDMILGCINCCLFDIGAVLKGGFEMSNVQYTEPKTVLSALQVVGDITLVATAQQFGGFLLVAAHQPQGHQRPGEGPAGRAHAHPCPKVAAQSKGLLLRQPQVGGKGHQHRLAAVEMYVGAAPQRVGRLHVFGHKCFLLTFICLPLGEGFSQICSSSPPLTLSSTIWS